MPEKAKLIPAINVDPQTQSVIVLVGVAANVVLCFVSLIESSRSHASLTFGRYSQHLASVQGLARVLFRLYRIVLQEWALAWVVEEQRHLQVLQVALQRT